MILDSFVGVIKIFFIALSLQKIPQKQKEDKTFSRQDNRMNRISKKLFLKILSIL
jgi:hypothetical protein